MGRSIMTIQRHGQHLTPDTKKKKNPQQQKNIQAEHQTIKRTKKKQLKDNKQSKKIQKTKKMYYTDPTK